MADPFLSGWPIEIDGRFPAVLILLDTPPPRPKPLPPPLFIPVAPGELLMVPRP